ncbi:arginyl-tRNA--protein transferase 1-like isoform X4 [Anopheles merus]|uniref:arginyl-tRNA--protein transferase 1-like isoform X4 n=1 Tax=Anopheles merus TaxID=30066 RepID=UPI001BE46BEA|nr:arginyl-tRNA--protein transferase 1-like isoform X4 [Anopheles merus]
MSYSVVEYYGENSKYQCGYCKQSSSCSSYGMWAHKLSCQDYQELIDRGWRRSGCYCYKPMMDVTCCPSYTIKCDAINFRLNKSHKKIIKRMNKFLRDGIKETSEQEAQSNINDIGTHLGSACDQEHTEVPSMQPHVLDPDVLNTLTHVNSEKRSSSADDKTSALPIPTLSGVVNSSTHTSDSSISNQPKKAKLRRIERKREKLQKKGLSGADIEQLMQSNNQKSAEKSLEEFLSESPQDNDSPAHRLKIVTLLTSGVKFQESLHVSFNLYKKYQTAIHNDPPGAIEDYLDFLVKSPLKSLKYGDPPKALIHHLIFLVHLDVRGIECQRVVKKCYMIHSFLFNIFLPFLQRSFCCKNKFTLLLLIPILGYNIRFGD